MAQAVAAASPALIGAVTIPGMLGLIVVAPEFVGRRARRKWAAAIPVIQILAWVGLLQSLQGLNASVLLARDRTGTLLRYSSSCAVASRRVVRSAGSAGASSASRPPTRSRARIVEPYYTWLTARSINASLRELWSSISGVAQAAARWRHRRSLPAGPDRAGRLDVLLLLTLIPLGIAVYLPLLAWREPEVLGELR